MEDKAKRSIKIEFLNVPDFFLEIETREIDEDAFVSEIRTINPQVIIIMICYSQFLDLKFLLERSGLFPAMRMNRELNIISKGQILTMNNVQKEFIHTMADQDNVEKDVVITGPVGSGKTILGLEAINIKKSHYKKKYGISSSDCQKKLRVIVIIGMSQEESQLKQQLDEMSKSVKDCTLDTVHQLDFHHRVLTHGSHLLSFKPMKTKIIMNMNLPMGDHLVPRKLTSASTRPHWRPFS